MIYVTGDTHGDWMSRLNSNVFPEQKEMTKDDCVLILGDFGIWDNSKSEKYNLDWLEKKPFTTLFVSGNHENYDILDSLPVSLFLLLAAQAAMIYRMAYWSRRLLILKKRRSSWIKIRTPYIESIM